MVHCCVNTVYCRRIPVFYSSIHFFSLYLHSLNYLRFTISPSLSPSPFPSPSLSPSPSLLSPSLFQQTKIIQKGEVQRTIRCILIIDTEIALLDANRNTLKFKTTAKITNKRTAICQYQRDQRGVAPADC